MLKVKESSSNRRVFIQLSKLQQRSEQGVRAGFFRLGAVLVDTMRRDMLARNKTGRVYNKRTRSGRRRKHRASAPGETAANDTGRMRRLIGFQIRGSDNLEFGVREGEDYPAFLEDGTARIAPRPSVGNTVRKLERDARTFFDAGLQSELLKP